MSDEQASTGSSLYESAKSTINAAMHTLTGNPADKAVADEQAASAQAKSELSHATAKIGSYTATADGAVAKDDARRSEGSWEQTIGSGKEMLGNVVGSEDLKQAGAQQNAEGKALEARGQLSDLGKGAADRVTGVVGGAVAGVTGDTQAQEQYQAMHDEGKARQRGAEVDIQKQAPQ